MSNNSYKYTILTEDEIRLIALHPATSNAAPLECNIEIRKRDTNPKYAAISYVWAADKDNTFSALNVLPAQGETLPCSQNIFIGPTLATALRRFRSQQEERLLWTDAICIDQNNEVEKSQQVPMMEKTYSQAERVLVWLGEATESTNKAIDFMGRMLEQDIDNLVKTNAEQWHAVADLMRMPWFSRRWIVQEIALARDAAVYCGQAEIHWREFSDAVGLFDLHYSKIKATFLNESYDFSRNRLGELNALGACRLVKITSNLFRKSNDGVIQRRLVSLEGLVSILTMFDASHAHDVIYALIAISKDIRTVSQLDRSVAWDALPVRTPRHEIADDSDEPSSKRQMISRASGSTINRIAWRSVMQEVREQNKCRNATQDEERPRKGASRFQETVRSVVSKQSPRFEVDYRKSFLRVCIDFVAFAILQSHSLDIICRPWVPQELKEKHHLPSWLIDTDHCAFRPQADGTLTRINADPLVGSDATKPKRYSACGQRCEAPRLTRKRPTDGWGFGFFDRDSEFEREHDFREMHDHRSLFVCGFVLDQIDSVQDKAEDGTIPSEWFRLVNWRDRSQLPPEHFWRTLVADRAADGTMIDSFYPRTLRNVVSQHTTRGGALNIKAILATPRLGTTSETLLERILAVATNRRLFKTTARPEGLLGLAPAQAQKGDLVCVLYGCSVPVILREQVTVLDGRSLRSYQLLGDAYVHGMMDGDAMDEQEKLGIPVTQFELR